MHLDNNDGWKVGDLGFVLEAFNTSTGHAVWSLARKPGHTNQSHELRLRGWLGGNGNITTDAHGVAIVTKLFPRSGRMCVNCLAGKPEVAALRKWADENGYDVNEEGKLYE